MSTTQSINHAITDAVKELAGFISILHKRFGSQLPHDVLNNLPANMVQYEKLPKHSVRMALVAAIGEYLNWDTEQVARFAAETLEDSNIHYLAKIVYDQLENYGNDEKLST
jgi:hypothetical protein